MFAGKTEYQTTGPQPKQPGERKKPMGVPANGEEMKGMEKPCHVLEPLLLLLKTHFNTEIRRVHGTGILIPRYGIHPYYTLKFTKIQVKLAKIPFFVNYDDFYVNIVMSTL